MGNRLNKLAADAVVIGALFVAIVFAVRHALEKGIDFWSTLALIVGLAVVAVGEYLFWHRAACAWYERRVGRLITCSLLGAILTGGVVWTNFSSSSAINDGKLGVQLSRQDVQVDTRGAIAALEADQARLQEGLRMKPKRTPEEARSAQDNAKAHRWWKSTDGCKETHGPQTRAFCDAYRAAEADEAGGTEARLKEAELAQVQAKLADLRKERRTQGPAVVSADGAAVLILAKHMNVSEAEARTMDSMVVPFMMQALLLLGGIVKAGERYGDQVLKPWINWARVGHGVACIAAAVRGQPLPTSPITHNHVTLTKVEDDGLRQDLAELLGGFKGSKAIAHAA